MSFLCAPKPKYKDLHSENLQLREFDIHDLDEDMTLKVILLHPCNVLTLKNKLRAELGSNNEELKILYKFQLLKDEDTVPIPGPVEAEAGDEEILAEDARGSDALQWKLHLLRYPMEAAESKDGEGEVKDAEQDPFEEKRSTFLERQRAALAAAEVNARKKSFEQDHSSLASADMRSKSSRNRFDIFAEMRQIGCERFAQDLADLGFNEKGAFAHLRDEDMDESRQWIYKRARVRILAVAEMYKRQLHEEDKQVKSTLQELDKEAAGKYTMDGINFYATKVEVKQAAAEMEATAEKERLLVEAEKAMREAKESKSRRRRASWAQEKIDADALKAQLQKSKQQLEVEEEAKAEKRLPKRDHSDRIECVMQKIRFTEQYDEYDVQLHRPVFEAHWCCRAHAAKAGRAKEIRIDTIVRLAELEIEERLAELDTWGNSFFSPADLRAVAQKIFADRFLPLFDVDIDFILRQVLEKESEYTRKKAFTSQVLKLLNRTLQTHI